MKTPMTNSLAFSEMKGKRIITLSGFMGSGKSTVGKIAASHLSFDFRDLDEIVETGCGMSIPDIFALHGEMHFREIEYTCLKETISEYNRNGKGLVLSLGGGTVIRKECAALIARETYCIYLKASVGTLVSNLRKDTGHRPLLDGEHDPEKKIVSLMSSRKPIYESCCDKIICTDGKTPEEISENIILSLPSPSYP